MNKAAEQALTSLVPSLSALPSELVDLAISLLAQSRSIATSLKQEEEVARAYACAHLACERSKTVLDLPPIKARPPCPPRIYKKLYAYLDSALAKQSPHRRSNAAQNSATETSQPTSSTSTPRAPTTPAKRGRPRSTSFTPSKKARIERQEHTGPNSTEKDDLSSFLPAIRSLCGVLDSQTAVPHVYTGMCTILESSRAGSISNTPMSISGRRGRSNIKKDSPHLTQGDAPVLLIVLTVLVVTQLTEKTAPGEETLLLSEVLDRVLESEEVATTLDIDTQEDPDLEGLRAQAEKLMLEERGSWRDMEWFQNVRANFSAADTAKDEISPRGRLADEGDDLSTLLPAKVMLQEKVQSRQPDSGDDNELRPGLGTMFCHAVDWLSEERRANYSVWKREILTRLESVA